MCQCSPGQVGTLLLVTCVSAVITTRVYTSVRSRKRFLHQLADVTEVGRGRRCSRHVSFDEAADAGHGFFHVFFALRA